MVKRKVEQYGRDPDEFIFVSGISAFSGRGESRRNPRDPLDEMVRALFGRVNPDHWEAEGVERVFPKGWHYALKYLPWETGAEETQDILRRIPRR